LIEMREVPKKQGLPDFYILSFLLQLTTEGIVI